MSRHPRQLSFEQIVDIRTAPETVTELARKHGINRGVVSNVRHGITYKVDEEGLSYSGWPDGRIGEGCQPLPPKTKREPT